MLELDVLELDPDARTFQLEPSNSNLPTRTFQLELDQSKVSSGATLHSAADRIVLELEPVVSC